MLRAKDRSRSRENYTFISDRRFDELTVEARRNGAVILKGGDSVEEHLDNVGANASCVGDVLMFRERATISEVLEETRHFEQNRMGLNEDKPIAVRSVLNEIDVKNYLIENQKKYNIPRIEIEETKAQLQEYEDRLKSLKEQGYV